jgi:hypothetical protein
MNARAMFNVPLNVDRGANYRNLHTGGFTPVASTQGNVAAAFKASVALVRNPVVVRFRRLADQWKAETENMSSVDDMILHPAYQEIVGMGPAIITLLLHELEREPNHWFSALTAISGGQNPVSPENAGDVDKMTAAWLAWGDVCGYR